MLQPPSASNQVAAFCAAPEKQKPCSVSHALGKHAADMHAPVCSTAAGKSFRHCCRAMAASAGIVFSPYNYLLDGKIRGGLSSIKWAGAVLIFDEAHNLEVLLLMLLVMSSFVKAQHALMSMLGRSTQ